MLPSVCLFVCLSVCPCVRLSICPSVSALAFEPRVGKSWNLVCRCILGISQASSKMGDLWPNFQGQSDLKWPKFDFFPFISHCGYFVSTFKAQKVCGKCQGQKWRSRSHIKVKGQGQNGQKLVISSCYVTCTHVSLKLSTWKWKSPSRSLKGQGQVMWPWWPWPKFFFKCVLIFTWKFFLG